MALLLFFSFLAGLATILAPCIWPVLPIVLSSSFGAKNHQKSLGITLGVMLSFSFFTLSISYLVNLFHLDPNILRAVAVVIIAFLGLMMIIPALAAKFEILVGKLSNLFGQKQNSGPGFFGGFITGLSLGIVWTPCAGPILATIATLAATGKVTLDVILVTVFYVTGVGVPLFLFAYGGSKLITNLKGVNKFTGKIQKVFGVIMILTAIAIYTNYAQTLQLQLIAQFPALGTITNGFENSSLVSNQLNQLTGKETLPVTDTTNLFNTNTPSPKLTGITNWLNLPAGSVPPTIASLKGKVVLVDFWTYTCINCIRTLPFVTSWYDKYHDAGFAVIGVHTPEFQFEHDANNVTAAIKQYNIHYPVAQDNNYATWNAFSNNYWPAEYLIDSNGVIRRAEFGEGNYDQTEKAIQELLLEAGNKNVTTSTITMPDQTPTREISPETYLGTNRAQPSSDVTVDSTWQSSPEFITSAQGSTITYNFTASKVYIILAPPNGAKGTVKVFLDGKAIDSAVGGADVKDGIITVDSDRLYSVVNLGSKTETHTLKLEFDTSGVQAFTFTFG